jgi:hypothetical protein
MMDYSAIIKRSVELTWRNKLLWVFGILVAVFTGGAGNAGQGLQYTFNQQDVERWSRSMPYGGDLPWRQLAALGAGVILFLVFVGLIMIAVSIIVAYTSEGALVAAADDLDGGRKPTFREAVGRGWQRFLRLFAQDLIIGLITFVVGLLVLLAYALVAGLLLAPGIVAVTADGTIRVLGIIWLVLLGLVVILGLILLMAAVGAGQSLVRAYAMRASVLNLEGVFDALGSAWALLRSRLRESLTMWLWMALVSLGIGLLMVPIGLLIAAMLVVPAAGAYALGRSAVLPALIIVPLLALLAILVVWLGGLYTAFQSTVWTLTYNQLAGRRD